MLLHSIATFEQIFPPTPEAVCVCRPIHGGMLEGRLDNSGFTVSRLISTDPRLYLDPRYSPGNLS